MPPADPELLFALLAEQGVAVAELLGGRVSRKNGLMALLGDDEALSHLSARVAEGPALSTVAERTFEVGVAREPADRGDVRLLVGRDVTAREEARRHLARSDEILRVGAHELRNPLHVIGMICHLLETRAGRSEPLDRATLDRLRRQVARMNRLITQLIDLSRVQEGRLVIDLVEGDLAQLVRDQVAEIVPRRASDLRVELPETAKVMADDRGRLAEVVHQLLDNAVRFTDASTPIDLALRDRGETWELVVRDHGPGIPEGDRATLFQRDPRLDRKRGPQGLGLGLYIAANVVRLHGGELTFQPTEPTGATFTLRLPKPAATPA